MRKYLATIFYFISLFILIPIGSIVNKLIYRYYFNLYGRSDEWDIYYKIVENLKEKVFIAIIALIILIYIWNIISSFAQIKKYESKYLIKQALIVQIVSLIISNIIVLILIFGTIISSLNIFGALIGLPIFYFLSIILIILINLIGSFRGISTIISLKNEKIIYLNTSMLYEILEFIPIVNLIILIVLNDKLKKKGKI